MARNVYYFRVICALGGVEQFLYEIAKAYGLSTDIEIYYDEADQWQLDRLKKFVRCTKRIKGQKVYCERFFANFNLDMVDDVISSENYYAFVIHANFDELGYNPPLHPKINHYIAVSKFAQRKFYELKGIMPELCYNPIDLEPKEKVMHLVSACRLHDVVKGGERTKRLIQALDNYCERTGRHYIWHIFSKDPSTTLISKNVAIMPPRTDVRSYIQDADILLTLSNDMETYCYSNVEAWEYGVHTITTPLSVLEELNVPKEANYILDWNCENIEDVVRHIFEDELKPFTYKAPKDNWGNLFVKGESEYQKELKMKYKIKAVKWENGLIDKEVGRVRQIEEVWIVDGQRLNQLKACDQLGVEVLEELSDEVIENAIAKPKATKKAVKKSTK